MLTKRNPKSIASFNVENLIMNDLKAIEPDSKLPLIGK